MPQKTSHVWQLTAKGMADKILGYKHDGKPKRTRLKRSNISEKQHSGLNAVDAAFFIIIYYILYIIYLWENYISFWIIRLRALYSTETEITLRRSRLLYLRVCKVCRAPRYVCSRSLSARRSWRLPFPRQQFPCCNCGKAYRLSLRR